MQVGADHRRDRDQVAVLADAPGAFLGFLAGAIVGDRSARRIVISSPTFSSSACVGHDSTYKPRSNEVHEGGPFGQRVDQDVFVVGMGAGAARAQAVEGRDSQSRGEVAVAAAAGRSLGQLEAEAAGASELPGFLEKGRVGGGSLHRRPVERAAQRQSIVGVDGARALRRADSIRASSAWVATRTSISAEAWAGTTLVVVPPRIDADVDRGSGGQVLQVLELEDLVGKLDDRASAVLGCHAGVGRLAFDLEMETADPFPRGLEPAVGQGRLEHQGIGTVDRELSR